LDQQQLFNLVFGLDPHWDYTFFNTYSTSKNLKNFRFDSVDLKGVCIEGSIVVGVRRGILFSIALDKHPSFEIFVNLKQQSVIKKSVL